MDKEEPRPRFAHQLVYNSTLKCQYLFGGNPGETNQPNLRLDDFWQLFLTRPLAGDILRKALFRIRTQKFKELCLAGDKNAALTYLQTQVSQTVNHEDNEESQEFRALVLFLFSWNPKRGETVVVQDTNSRGLNDSNGVVSKGTLFFSLFSFAFL